MRAGWLLIVLLSHAVFADGPRDHCSAKLGLEIRPDGGDADVKGTYTIDCSAPSYFGQATRIRTQLPFRTSAVQVSDGSGPLDAAPFDPPFFKVTPQEKSTLVSITPRNAIIIGGFSNKYSFSEAYSARDSIPSSDGNSVLKARDFVGTAELVVAVDGAYTSFQPQVTEYSLALMLPEGAELKGSTAACKVEQGTVRCEGIQDLASLSLVWREKSFPEKVMQKGWPWILLGVKSFFGGLLG